MNVLITGGASGLGEAITKKMAQLAGGTVYFTYNSSAANAAKLEQELGNCKAIRCNFGDASQVSALAAAIEGMNLDVLINNAWSGGFIESYFHKTESANFLSAFEKNILPVISVTQAAIHSFRKKKNGRIVTVLTAALLNTPPIGSSVYTATKAYLQELTKAWATENIRFNISSNSVSPSFMPAALTGSMDERLVEQMLERHPLKRFLTPGEVADSVAHLAQAPAQVNGVNIVLNAGADLK